MPKLEARREERKPERAKMPAKERMLAKARAKMPAKERERNEKPTYQSHISLVPIFPAR